MVAIRRAAASWLNLVCGSMRVAGSRDPQRSERIVGRLHRGRKRVRVHRVNACDTFGCIEWIDAGSNPSAVREVSYAPTYLPGGKTLRGAMVCDPVSLAASQGITWRLLEGQPSRRPSVDDVVREVGRSTLQLRRDVRRHNALLQECLGSLSAACPMRDVLTFCCVAYAAHLIGHGTKIDAARQLAGFQPEGKSGFNKQFRNYFGCTPQQFRDRGSTYELPPPGT